MDEWKWFWLQPTNQSVFTMDNDAYNSDIAKYTNTINVLNGKLKSLDPNDPQVPYIVKNLNALHNAILDTEYKKNSRVGYSNLEDFRQNRGYDARGTYDERIGNLKQRFESGNIDYNQYVNAIDMINQEEQQNYNTAKNNDGASMFDRLMHALNVGRR